MTRQTALFNVLLSKDWLSASFENANEFELHMVAGVHQCSKVISSMDRVKNTLVTKMKSSPQLHLPLSNDEVNIADMHLEDAVQCFPIIVKLKELGWIQI